MDIAHHDDAEFVKWYRRLGPVEQAKLTWQLDLLMAVGTALGMPHVRDLGDGLRELRVRVGRQPRLYFQIEGTMARMLTYGRKDTQQRDIGRARGRMTT
jgi:putative addiction module killer protein